jgi:hypothetical protein
LGNTVLNAEDYFTFNHSATRGHRYKLHVVKYKSLPKKHVFSRRIVNVWNSLPDSLFEIGSLQSFKSRLIALQDVSGCLNVFVRLDADQLEQLLDSRGIDR